MRERFRELLRRSGVDAVSARTRPGFELYLRLLKLRLSAPLHFLQVGAQDGVTGDPIRAHVLAEGWIGAFVEPRQAMFDRLRANYAGRGGLQFVRAAVFPDAGPGARARLFAVDPNDVSVPAWAHGLGSFDEATLLRHEADIPGLRDRIVVEDVPVMDWHALLEQIALPRIDLLQIDVEGADALLVRSFPLERVRPGIVRYEHKHLSAADRVACEESLVAAGYAPLVEAQDTVALSLEASPKGNSGGATTGPAD